MSDEKIGRSATADGPKMLCEINPKGAARFAARVCETCNQPIMTHWMVWSEDPELRGTYWCDPERNQASQGMKI